MIVAAERSARPHTTTTNPDARSGPEQCPFCPGHEDRTPPETYRTGEPGGTLIVGITGRTQNVVNRLAVLCAPPSERAEVGAKAVTEGTAAGSDMGKEFSFSCGAGAAAIGITGRAGALIDRIGVVCAPGRP